MKKLTLVSLLLVAVFVGCSSTKKASNTSLQDEALQIARAREGQDARLYESIDRDFRARKHQDVLDKTKVFIKNYSNSALIEQAYHLRALSSIALKQYPNALAQLKKTLEIAQAKRTANEQLVSMVTYNMAYVHFEMGQFDQAASYLAKVKPSSFDVPNQSRFYILSAKVSRMNQDYKETARNILLAIETTPANSAQVKPLAGFLSETLENLESQDFISQLYKQFEESPAADHLLYRLALQAQKNGNRNKANEYYEKIYQSFPNSQYYSFAANQLKVQQQSSEVDSRKVGILLTLSGKFSKVGYRTLQGAQLAFRVFQPSATGGPSLVVMGDQGDPSRAVQALEELYYKHHVVAVIGPMSSKVVDAVAKRANELGVSLITLSQKEPPRFAVDESFVFSAGLTPTLQVSELMRYVNGKMKLSRFAVMAPNNRFGEEYAKGFWDELDRTGGSIRGYEMYPEDETDFRTYIDKMVGLAAADARKRELDELQTLKDAALQGRARNKRAEQMFHLKPIIDFDAVFIPDDPKVLGQILPTFAYRDVDKMQFLGINTWNNPELIARAGQFAEGAIFVDGFYAKSTKPAVQKFIQEYQAVFGYEPGLMEALSYDASRVLQSLLTNDAGLDRVSLRRKLTEVRDFPGISGGISYRPGSLLKTIHLLTLHGGKIEEIAF